MRLVEKEPEIPLQRCGVDVSISRHLALTWVAAIRSLSFLRNPNALTKISGGRRPKSFDSFRAERTIAEISTSCPSRFRNFNQIETISIVEIFKLNPYLLLWKAE